MGIIRKFKKKSKEAWAWLWRFGRSVFGWKHLKLKVCTMDDILFRILSVVEAIIVVSGLIFFYFCCGCRI
ncbi:uncharacterized protein LOC143889242 [Tasmannia lanceolata]|uniref:uncharacterized protein LOC143889242 n=1 Tax=Tasmannia lanceolata TaxID=3420 RepID=UPI004064A7F3